MNSKKLLVWALGLLLCTCSICPKVQAAEQIVELRLQMLKALRGVVLYSNGDTVKGAKVAELASEWKTELRTTTTDSEGHFSLPSVKGRKVYYLQVTVPGAAGVNPLRVPAKLNRFWGKGSLLLRLNLA